MTALGSAAATQPQTAPRLFDNSRPPARFQSDTTVVLEIRDQAGIDAACQPLFGRPPPGMKTDACQVGRKVIAPNPCLAPQSESYARMLCHELGHANGWSRLHEDLSRAEAETPRAGQGAAASSRPGR